MILAIGATLIALGCLVFTGCLYLRDECLTCIMILVDVIIIVMCLCAITQIAGY